MFLQDAKDQKWHYRCDACREETEKRNHHDSSAGLEGWHVKGYAEVHNCPPCQTAGKTPE